MLERLGTDLTAVVRNLRSSRALTLVSILTLAAAIGMNVAMFGLVDRALLSPARHIKDPDTLFTVGFEREDAEGRPLRMTTTSYPSFRTLRDEVQGLAGIAAWQRGPSAILIEGQPADAETMLVTDGYFAMLGVTPLLGRGLSDPSQHAVAISHGCWLRVFRGDPNVLGRRMTLGGVDFQVAAVMPRGFSGHAPTTVDAWFPIELAMANTPGWDNPYRNAVSIVARVSRGETASAATRATSALNRKVVLLPLTGGEAGSDERIAYWLAGVSAIVLLIGLANAMTLLFVRAARRRREMAIRAALGASRGRLLWHFTLESLIVGLSAAAAALILASWLDDLVRRVLLPNVVERDGMDPRTIAGALVAGLVAAVLATLASAAQRTSFVAQGFSPAGFVAQGFSPARRRRVPIQHALLVLQTTLSVLLLAGAGMFGRSLYALATQNLGMRMNDVLLADFEQGVEPSIARDQIFISALDRIRALPGVTAATKYQVLPFTGFHVPPIAVPGRPTPPQVEHQLPFLTAATPELFSILDITVTDGRGFTPADDRGAPVVIVNESMARGVWPGERAVGRCIRIGFDEDFEPGGGPAPPSDRVPCREVVGVVNDVRQRSIVPTGIETRLMQYYVPFSQVPPPPAAAGVPPGWPHIGGLLVRAARDPDSLASAIRRSLVNGRSDLPSARVRRYASLLDRQLRPWRLGTTLLGLFSGLAVAIAAVGLYAAFAHAVTLRRREIAIRIAIGATAAGVRAMILRDATILTMVGTVAGLVGAFAAGRSLQSLLYGIVPADPLVLAGVALVMIAIAAVATALPARSASRTDPNALLRAE